jgi:hypothetical protein
MGIDCGGKQPFMGKVDKYNCSSGQPVRVSRNEVWIAKRCC